MEGLLPLERFWQAPPDPHLRRNVHPGCLWSRLTRTIERAEAQLKRHSARNIGPLAWA